MKHRIKTYNKLYTWLHEDGNMIVGTETKLLY